MKPTEVQIQHIMEPLKAAELRAENRECRDCEGEGKIWLDLKRGEFALCSWCAGTGLVSQYDPADEGEAALADADFQAEGI